MRKSFYQNIHTLLFLLLFINPFHSAAQKKQTSQPEKKADNIVMLSGEKRTGNITSINSDVIKFIYPGETAEYEIKKSEIAKIEFGSGRVEVINTAAPVQNPAPVVTAPPVQQAEPVTKAEDRKNKIAILPFEIMTNDASLKNASMSRQVQESCVEALRDQSPFQAIQDPMVTNSILAKHHFTTDSLIGRTPQEWAELLGVEFVIIGSYEITNKGSYTSGSGYSSYDTKKESDDKKTTAYGSTSSSTSTNYDTKVNLRVYNDAGQNIYSDTHSPFFGGIDSYNPAVKWLIKRTPFAKK